MADNLVRDHKGTSQSRTCGAFQFQHDSFQQFEIVDVLDRREPVLLENGNERLRSQFVESGFQTSPATFGGPHVLQYPLLEGDVLDLARAPHACQIAQQPAIEAADELLHHTLDFTNVPQAGRRHNMPPGSVRRILIFIFLVEASSQFGMTSLRWTHNTQ